MFTPNDIIRVFRPSAPIEESAYFIGRKEQKTELERCLYAPGRHAIVYGPRGVGKSSLVKIVEKSLSRDWSVGYFRTSSNTVYSDIIHKLLLIFGKINYESEKKQITSRDLAAKVKIPIAEGGATSKVQEEVTIKPAFENTFTPDFLASNIKKKSVLFIDEFDIIKSEETKQLITELIKILSDYNSPLSIVLVGVANKSTELIQRHHSVIRNIMPINIPIMEKAEIKEILIKGFNTLKIKIDENLVNQIVLLSNGLPYFPHLLGEVLSYHALVLKRRQLKIEDLLPVLSTSLNIIDELVHEEFDCATSVEYRLADFTSFSRKTTTNPLIKRFVLYGLALSNTSDLDEIADFLEKLFSIKQINYIPLLREHSESTKRGKLDSSEIDGIDIEIISEEISQQCCMLSEHDGQQLMIDPFFRSFVYLKALDECGSELIQIAQQRH